MQIFQRNKYSKTLLGCALFLLLTISPSFVDAAKDKGAKVVTEEQPITILAEYLHFDNISGDLFAEGNVRLIRDGQTVLADRIDGNIKSADVWTKTQTEFQQDATNTKIIGQTVKYNYNDKTGEINTVNGKTGNQYINADKIDILPEKLVGENASMARCNAKDKKCYHITAERVDIWPNDKLIAYNVKIYVLGKKFITKSRHAVSLTGETSEVPRIGYSNDHGVFIKQTLTFPMNLKTSVGVDLFAATGVGGRSMFWLNHAETNFNLKYSYGYQDDKDDEWLKKENNIRFDYHPKYLFGLPWKYRLWYERGLWKETGGIRSWHTEIGVYLNRDPIYFGSTKSLWLNLGTGYRRLEESLNNIGKDEYRYDIGLHKRFSQKWQIGAVYSNVSNNVSLFEYDKIDVAESLTYTIKWKPDKLNQVEFLQQYDTQNSRVFKNRITYTRNLHCWDLVLYYERKNPINGNNDNKFHWEINLAI